MENGTSESHKKMKWEFPLTEAQYLGRINRFTGEVYVRKQILSAHIPNSSHLRELLVPGAKIYLLDRRRGPGGPKPYRRLGYTILLVKRGNILSCIDAHMPNGLFREAFQNKKLEPFLKYTGIKPEVPILEERLDFLLFNENGEKAFVEVKSCTLVRKGVGFFPDPATARGVRHLELLTKLAQKGYPAHLIFIIQRQDAECIKPNEAVDPAFAKMLAIAQQNGVQLSAYTCRVSLKGIEIFRSVPVCL